MSLQLSTTLIDAGYVDGRREYAVTLTNTSASSVTLTTILTPAFRQGLAISGPQPPQVVAAGESLAYTIIVRRSGEPRFSGSWVFSSASFSAALTISGERVVRWPFKTNWSDPVSFRAEWKTDIFVTPGGQERRVAQRHQPRRSLSVKCLVYGDDFPRARALLSGAIAAPVVLADPTRSALTTGSGLASALPLPSGTPWLTAGSWVEIGGEEIARVVSFSAGSAVFERALSRTWPAGTVVRPALRGEWNDDTKNEALTGAVSELSISVRETPGEAAPEAAGALETTFNGREVFPFVHNWASRQSAESSWSVETIDPGYGPIYIDRPQLFGQTVAQVSLLFRDSATIDRYVRFFNRMRGRQGEFYRSTGLHDLRLVAGAERHSSGWIRVRGVEAFHYLQDFETSKAIEAISPAGVERRRIIGYALEGETTLINLDQDPAIHPENWTRTSWLQVCRFATDTLTLTYLTDSVARTRASLVTLEDL